METVEVLAKFYSNPPKSLKRISWWTKLSRRQSINRTVLSRDVFDYSWEMNEKKSNNHFKKIPVIANYAQESSARLFWSNVSEGIGEANAN